MIDRWIQHASPKKGALHRELGYPPTEHIPVAVLQRIKAMPLGGHIHGHTVTKLMKRRANLALTFKRF